MSSRFAPGRTSAGAALALAALLLVALDGTAAPGKRVLQRTTAGEIEALAMDGPRIAYDVSAEYGGKRRCNTVYVWNVRRGVTSRVSGRQTCGADSTSTGDGVRELALAGGRVAWIVNQGGNTESRDSLYTTVVAGRQERLLASAYRTGNVDEILTGNWLGGLVGATGFLAVDHWATDTHGTVRTARLQSVASQLSTLAEGLDTMVAESTDGKQVAVLRRNDTVGLYSTAGRLLRTVTPDSATDAAVRGDYLVVLTEKNTLEVYNSHSGKRLHAWRVARSASDLDVSSGLASYAAPLRGGNDARTVHVIRLSNGKDQIVVRTRARAVIEAVELEPTGLAYALNRRRASSGLVAFVPMSRLRR